MLKISRDQIDSGYIDQWADALRLRDIWDAIQQRLSP